MGKRTLLVTHLMLLVILSACGQGPDLTRYPNHFEVAPAPTPLPTKPIAKKPKPIIQEPTTPEDPDPVTQGPFEQSVGLPWKGHLINATDVGFQGPGFVKIFQERKARYATYDLLNVVEKALQYYQGENPRSEPIQIGDISAEYGGPLYRHQSHQSGLDIDIRFLSKNHHVQTVTKPGTSTDSGFDEEFVVKGMLSPDFDTLRNWSLIKGLAKTNRINRIFVASPIKKALCQLTKEDPFLAHVQILENHIDHMHVRITCPTSSPRCEAQEPVPPGSGCGHLVPVDDPSGLD